MCVTTQKSYSQNVNYNKIKEVERWSAILTGMPAQTDLLSKFAAGELTEDAYLNELLSSEEFVRHFSRFWTPKLGIGGGARMTGFQQARADSTSSVRNEVMKGSNRFLVLSRSLLGDLGESFDTRRNIQPTVAQLNNYITQLNNELAISRVRTVNLIPCTYNGAQKRYIARPPNFAGYFRPDGTGNNPDFFYLRAETFNIAANDIRRILKDGKWIDVPQLETVDGQQVVVSDSDGNPLKTRPDIALSDQVLPLYTQINELATEYLGRDETDCSLEHLTEVNKSKVYWADGIKVKLYAAKGLLKESFCDEDLSKCVVWGTDRFLGGAASLQFDDQSFAQDLNLEPGYIIGKIVADDFSFDQSLKSTKTVMSPRYIKGLKALIQKLSLAYKNDTNFVSYWKNFPYDPKEYEGVTGKQVGEYLEESTIWTNPDWSDQSLHWVERNSRHAGILSTYAFQTQNNGHRAKANRIFEAFTCSKFVVPEGIEPNPKDSNPDLTKRQYCAACHRTLEPMSAFFNGWPRLGGTHYEFASFLDQNFSKGRFDGKIDFGLEGYAKLISENKRFDACAIQRSFEFVVGRTWTSAEKNEVLSETLSEFQESGRQLKAVLRHLVKWMKDKEI